MSRFIEIPALGRPIQLTLLTSDALKKQSLENRILDISSRIELREAVICDIGLIELTTDIEGEQAKINEILCAAADSIDRNGGLPEGQTRAQYLTDSIENVAICHVTAFISERIGAPLSTEALMFIPIYFAESLRRIAGISKSIAESRCWKENTVNVFEISSRFRDETQNWRSYDPTRYDTPTTKAVARALGLGDTVATLNQGHAYGYGIGKAVGKEHSNQWLPMDLKLEHFLHTSVNVAHIDHEHDVFLFRRPTIEERAKSIAPLYQQMEYWLWHSFRLGYCDHGGSLSLDVLELFEGEVIGEILGVRCVHNAGIERGKGDFEAAKVWYDRAEKAFRAFTSVSDSQATHYLTSLYLVRADMELQRENWIIAWQMYDKIIFKLEQRRFAGEFVDEQIIGATINSAIALKELNKDAEAQDRLSSAKIIATALSVDNPVREHMLNAINSNQAAAQIPTPKSPTSRLKAAALSAMRKFRAARPRV